MFQVHYQLTRCNLAKAILDYIDKNFFRLELEKSNIILAQVYSIITQRLLKEVKRHFNIQGSKFNTQELKA